MIDTDGYDITIAQPLEDAAGQAGRLVKTGAGTLTLSGTNTFTGDTIVSNGTLRLQVACLDANADLRIAGPGLVDLAFAGTNLIHALYDGDTALLAGLYSTNNLPARLQGGPGVLNVQWPLPPMGTVISIR